MPHDALAILRTQRSFWMNENDGATPAASETQAAPASRVKRSRLWAGLTLLALLAALCAIAWPRLAPFLMPVAAEKQESFGPRLDTVEKRVAALETRKPLSSAPDMAPLEARIAALEQRAAEDDTDRLSLATLAGRLDTVQAMVPADLPQRLESFALKTAEMDLASRVKALEEQNAGAALHRAALALSLAELARAARDSKPFAEELTALSAASPGDPIVTALMPYAVSGVKSQNVLAAEFPAHARAALAAERTANAQGFLARLWSNVANVVSIRRIGDPQGNDSEDRLARAQIALSHGNLMAALAETSALSGPAAETMEPWRREAEARRTLDEALVKASSRVVKLLADNQSPAP